MKPVSSLIFLPCHLNAYDVASQHNKSQLASQGHHRFCKQTKGLQLRSHTAVTSKMPTGYYITQELRPFDYTLPTRRRPSIHLAGPSLHRSSLCRRPSIPHIDSGRRQSIEIMLPQPTQHRPHARRAVIVYEENYPSRRRRRRLSESSNYVLAQQHPATTHHRPPSIDRPLYCAPAHTNYHHGIELPVSELLHALALVQKRKESLQRQLVYIGYQIGEPEYSHRERLIRDLEAEEYDLERRIRQAIRGVRY